MRRISSMGLRTLMRNIKFLMKHKLYSQDDNQFEDILKLFAQTYDVFLVFPCAIGETTCFASCLIEWKKTHNKEIIVLIKSETMYEVLSLYKDINVIKISSNIFNRLINKKRSYINYLNDVYNGSFKEKNMYTLIKRSMNLPLSFSHNKCLIDKDSLENAKKTLANFGLNTNKTILCIPFANCLGDTIVSKNFWEEFCISAKKKGYNVIFNSNRPIVPNIPFCFLSFSETLSLSSICSKVVSVRTGLIDLISANSSNENIYVIYPNDKNGVWNKNPQIFLNLKQCFILDENKSLVDNYIETASLKMFNPSVKEYKNDSEEEIIERILL